MGKIAKKDIVLLLTSAAFIFLSVSCAGTRLNTPGEVRFNTFTYDDSPSFSIKYPTEWAQLSFEDGLAFFDPRRPEYPRMDVFIFNAPPAGFEPERALDRSMSAFNSYMRGNYEYSEYIIKSKNIRTLEGGERAFEAMIEWRMKSYKFAIFVVTAQKNDKVVSISIVKRKPGLMTIEDMKKMAYSFSFVN